MPFLNRREIASALSLSFFLAVFLAAGFLPTCEQFFLKAIPIAYHPAPWIRRALEMLAFPGLAALFYLSLPGRGADPASPPDRGLWRSFWLPIAISAAFGWIHRGPSWILAWKTTEGRLDLFWYLACVTAGEELLFRGWFYNVLDRVWSGRMATATNPLPIAIWGSSLGFSLWHWQNVLRDPVAFVLFQSTYTFFTGLWLGYLRWKSKGLALPMAAHFAINAACGIFC
jgi:membrane protease YdiL (CAAX protease family)